MTTHRSRLRTLPLSILAVSALTLAACTNGEQDATDSAPTTATGEASTPHTTTADRTQPTQAQVPQADQQLATNLDIQAHRGGRGENTEESRAAFQHAMDLGVDTLELDIVLSKDGVPVVWHDPKVLPEKCTDTAPSAEGDEQYPYVGSLIHELTWEQLQTLNCSQALEDFPQAQHAAHNTMLRLEEVFDMAAERGWDGYYNIETKIEGEHREQSAEPQEFVDTIMAVATTAGTSDKITIQSFDWRSLEIVKKQHPDVPTVALYDETTWFAGSPWIGAADYDAADGDALTAIKKAGFSVASPGYAVPYGTAAGDADYHPVTTKEYVDKAHELGLKVVPWTVNDEATIRDQIQAGVDGIISDYPSLLVAVAKQYGWQPTHTAS